MQNASPDIFGLAEQRMIWTDQRHAALAQNIANANTPSYVARDVQSFSAYLARTEEKGAPVTAKLQAISGQHSPDGNTVTMDDELVRVADTDTANHLAMNIYKSYINLYKTALGRGS